MITWAGFLSQLSRLLDGDDTSSSVITPATLGQVISLAESRVYRESRCRWNEKDFSSVLVTSNRAPIPSDWEAPSVVHFGASPLQPQTEEFVLNQQQILSLTKYFAQAGAFLIFAGAVSDNVEVQGRYFCRLPALGPTTAETNDFFQNENNLFLYAALSAAAPFYGQTAMQPIWEAQYASLRDQINQAAQRSAYSAGQLRMRPSAGLLAQPSYSIPEAASVSLSTYADADYAEADYVV